jgi:hypothetical protein
MAADLRTKVSPPTATLRGLFRAAAITRDRTSVQPPRRSFTAHIRVHDQPDHEQHCLRHAL